MPDRERILQAMREASTQIAPQLDADDIPWCDDRCPFHDGKRCSLLGYPPHRICLPAVHILVSEVTRLQLLEHDKLS